MSAPGTRRCAVHRDKIAYGDGPSRFGHFYYPSDAADRPSAMRPVVLVHGGYWTTEFSLTIESGVARQYAERGAAVWNIEYRRVGEPGGGWPNTGRDVIDALLALDTVVPATLPAEVRDGIDWSSVAVVGHSAGGQLAVWATAQLGARTARTRITTVVAQSAALDLDAAGQVGRESVRDLIGVDHAEAPSRYRDASPSHQAPFDAHVIAIHAGADEAIPAEVSRRYVELVGARGQSAEVIVVPDEGHSAFLDLRSRCNRETIRVLGL